MEVHVYTVKLHLLTSENPRHSWTLEIYTCTIHDSISSTHAPTGFSWEMTMHMTLTLKNIQNKQSDVQY